MRPVEILKSIQVPDDVVATIEGSKVTIKGNKGVLTRDFSHAPISVELDRNTILVRAEWPRKKEAALVGTIYSHIQNMIIGVKKGFTYKLKIVFSHFPISIKVKENSIFIENFTGERRSRIAKIVGNVQVKVQSEDIIIQGINLEDVSQTAANIEQNTKVKKKDPRVFLDGIYVYKRSDGMEQ